MSSHFSPSSNRLGDRDGDGINMYGFFGTCATICTPQGVAWSPVCRILFNTFTVAHEFPPLAICISMKASYIE